MKTLSSVIRYAIKVLLSCKTEEQLNNAISCAVAIIVNKAKESDAEPTDPRGNRHKRSIPPKVVACHLCSGRGYAEGVECDQCRGSGRVVVCSDVTTYVKAHDPKDNE